jgi:hypothetical protein
MRWRCHQRFACLYLIALWCSVAASGGVAEGACVTDSIGVDPAISNVSESLVLGSAAGQTFYAPDTLISAVTVWRPPYQTVYALRLFLTTTVAYNDTLHLPVTNPMLYYGPGIVVYDSDPPGHQVPVKWTFDPPFVLPSRGWYAFFVQVSGCPQQDYYLALHWQSDAYRLGGAYRTIRSTITCVNVPPASTLGDDVDLCFSVEFCRDATTPTRRQTWGGLKMLYR